MFIRVGVGFGVDSQSQKTTKIIQSRPLTKFKLQTSSRSSIMSNRRRRLRREGFTLMEILLVAAILVILASMGTLAYRTLGKGAYGKIASAEISAFATACDVFYMDHQRFPGSLEELYNPQDGNQSQWNGPYMDRNKGDAIDPWGVPYEYSADMQNDRVILRSAGPNQKIGDADDISNVQS